MKRFLAAAPVRTVFTMSALFLALNACVAYDPLLGGSTTSKPTTSRAPAPGSTRQPAPPVNPAPPVAGSPSQPSTTTSVPRPSGPAAFLLEEANAHQRNGDLPAAAASIERAMRIEPNSPWLSLALAEVRLAQGDARQAETLAQRARVQSGGDQALKSESWMVTAQARRQSGDVAGANEAMRRAGQ